MIAFATTVIVLVLVAFALWTKYGTRIKAIWAAISHGRW